MKLPDKRLIFFNSLVSPLESKSRLNSNSRMNGANYCESKIRYCANRKQNRFNVDQSTGTLV